VADVCGTSNGDAHEQPVYQQGSRTTTHSTTMVGSDVTSPAHDGTAWARQDHGSGRNAPRYPKRGATTGPLRADRRILRKRRSHGSIRPS
jgi:hypothetical protein